MRLLHSFIPVSRLLLSSPNGLGWAHELKHDGYRQIHVRDGRVRTIHFN